MPTLFGLEGNFGSWCVLSSDHHSPILAPDTGPRSTAGAFSPLLTRSLLISTHHITRYCWGCAWPQCASSSYYTSSCFSFFLQPMPLSPWTTTIIVSAVISFIRRCKPTTPVPDISQLGTKYAATVSAWFFTHYSYDNLIYRMDNWLFNTRCEELLLPLATEAHKAWKDGKRS